MRTAGHRGGLWWERHSQKGQVDGVRGGGRARIYSVFMDTSNEMEKRTTGKKGRWEGEDKTLQYTLLVSGGGHRGEGKDRQTMFWVKKYKWLFVLEGMSPLWTAPAPRLLSPRLTPLPWLTTRATPLTVGLLSRLSPGQAPWPRAQPSAHSPGAQVSFFFFVWLTWFSGPGARGINLGATHSRWGRGQKTWKQKRGGQNSWRDKGWRRWGRRHEKDGGVKVG